MSEDNPNKHELDDPAFVERLRNGDENAFCELDRKLFTKFRGYLIRCLHFNKETAEDIVQELAKKLFQSRWRIDPQLGIRAWAARILRNLIRDNYKYRKTVLLLLKENMDDFVAQDELTQVHIPEFVNKAIENLGKKPKKKFRKFHKIITSLKDAVPKKIIMQKLGMQSSGAYDTTKSRALSELRKEIEKQRV